MPCTAFDSFVIFGLVTGLTAASTTGDAIPNRASPINNKLQSLKKKKETVKHF